MHLHSGVNRHTKLPPYLKDGLQKLCERHDVFTDLRGTGLFLGVQTPSGDIAARIVNALRRAGVLIGAAGRGNAALKIRPPLPFSRSDADYLIGTIEDVLNKEVER